MFDDGRVAISVTGQSGTIRVLCSIPQEGDAKPSYSTHGEWIRMSADVVQLFGFSGQGLTARHGRLICRWALEQGYRWAYIERQEGRVMPFSERIVGGDFDGWWRLDLLAARLNQRKAEPCETIPQP